LEGEFGSIIINLITTFHWEQDKQRLSKNIMLSVSSLQTSNYNCNDFLLVQ